MLIEQRIEVDGYVFLLQLQSKNELAHSLMTDNKLLLSRFISGMATPLTAHPLKNLVKEHKEAKG